MESIFMDKAVQPTESDLKEKLGSTYPLWSELKNWTFDYLKNTADEWSFPGKKYGWSFRIKEKKRNIVYFIPLDGFFKVALVFGQKATDQIMASDISKAIKTGLMEARVYMEGRGIRFDVKDDSNLKDIKTLIRIKREF
jgi:hypothetical protein